MSGFRCQFCKGSLMKVHYPKLYNMAHLFSLNVFTASKGSNNYILFTDMLCELGWRSLANRRIDARMILLYKIIHGYVAIELPTYFERHIKYTRHMHPLVYKQIHTAVSYYQHSFYPASIVLWNRLPSEVVLLEDLDSFRNGVCKINHLSP